MTFFAGRRLPPSIHVTEIYTSDCFTFLWHRRRTLSPSNSTSSQRCPTYSLVFPSVSHALALTNHFRRSQSINVVMEVETRIPEGNPLDHRKNKQTLHRKYQTSGLNSHHWSCEKNGAYCASLPSLIFGTSVFAIININSDNTDLWGDSCPHWKCHCDSAIMDQIVRGSPITFCSKSQLTNIVSSSFRW